MSNLQFDEDGMLIVPTASKEATKPSAERKPRKSGLQFDENGMLVVPSTTGAEGQGATPAPEQPKEPLSVGKVLKETGKAVVGGVRDGLQEMGETIQWAGEGIGNAITGGSDIYYTEEEGFEWLSPEEVKSGQYTIPSWQTSGLLGEGGFIDLPEVAENETMVGNMGRGIVQFVSAYGAVGKAANLAKAKTTAGAAAQAMSLGAATDFAAFDAHEDRFSDFLRDNVGLQDPITEYLSADGDDSVFEGKLKNAIEGLGMGLATEGAVRLIKLFKKAKKVQGVEGDEAAASIMNDGLAEIAEKEPELFDQLELFDEVSDPNLKHTGAGPERIEDVRAADANAQADVTVGADVHGPAVPRSSELEAVTTVNTDTLTDALTQEMAIRRGGSMADPNRALDGKLFNFDNMDADVDVKEVMNMAADDIVAAGIKDQTTFDEIVKDAKGFLTDAVEVSPEIIDASLARMAKDAEKQQGIVIAGKAMVQSLAREVETLASKIDAGSASKMDMEKFIRLEQRLVETSANLKSVITGSAQTTAAGRIRTADWLDGHEIATQDLLASRLGKDGGIQGIEGRAKAILLNKETKGGERGLLRIVETDPSTPMRVVNEIYINSILSGPKTHMVNLMSNAMNTLLLPAEKMVGGAMRLDGATMREGFVQYQGLSMALKDSFKMAGTALKRGRNILDPEAAILEANGVDYHAIRSQSENPVIRNLVNYMGETIRLPSRGLLAGDELFKQMNYRSNLYARLSTEASDLVAAGKITKEEMGQHIADRMATAFDRKGSARSQVDLDYAREATYTQDLRQDSPSRHVQDFTNRHPGMKLILPFVRTPTNILKAGVQRTPVLRRLSKSLMDDINSGDPRRMASANGKLATGSLMWGMGVTLAMEGRITGSGPKDPTLRARLMETGWRPYSVVTDDGNGGKRYVEYRRMDPYAMFLGIAADVAEIGGQVGEAEMSELATSAIIGLVNNVASKTYLQGLIDVVEGVSDPERFLPGLMRQYASSMVPFSAAQREMRKHVDNEMREVRSVVDAVMNTVPGFSDDLPARRSWITGEAIQYPKGWGADMTSPIGDAFAAANPIIAGDWKQDKVLDELGNLDFGFSAPTRKLEGVEMTTAQYSRLLELHGTVRIGRYNMYQALEKVFDSAQYDLGRERFQDAADPQMNPRVMMVQRVIMNFRKAARAKLLEEDADLRSQVEGVKREAFGHARSVYSGVADLAGQ
ncbi:hypothetical protein [Aliiroseovarius marinus]|uniref:hypothetical protein n=1 Tax=Aliiroseovarius marinus TaxID=2500159 RepID=UPI003D7CB4C3